LNSGTCRQTVTCACRMVAEVLRGLRWARGVRETIYLRGRALSPALLIDSIHRGAWKGNSPKFAKEAARVRCKPAARWAAPLAQ
jgi:hypothetical protein